MSCSDIAKVEVLISLEAIEAAVIGEPGKVFSTGPEVAIGEDGSTYYIKGRNSEIAFAEVAGCRLAAFAGLHVPRAHVASFEGNLYAAVKGVPHAQRNVRPFLKDKKRVTNIAELFDIIVIDAWLVNDDRNMGNIVGSALGNGSIELYAIDFERSRTLADSPFMKAGEIDPKRLWPTAELGSFVSQIKPPSYPRAALNKVRESSISMILEVIAPVAEELPFVTWHESSAEVLARRAKDLDRVMGAIWAAN